MAVFPRPVIMMIWSHPAASASSTPYWMMGLSTSGSISFGCALVAGRNRVPSPAAGNTAFRTFILICVCSQHRAVFPQHGFADDFDRRESLFQKFVVKLLQAELVAHLRLVIRAQLQNLQLPQR